MESAASLVSFEQIKQIADDLLTKVKIRPKIGIICGSGLGALADLVENAEIIDYSDIPHFPVSTVAGHHGKLVIGNLRGKAVVLMQGRAHCYEGYPVHKIAVPVRTMKLMGVETLFVTNAAGGLNENFKTGDIMIIKDHLNLPGFAGVNPLVGKNDESFGPRFPPMSDAYDLELRKLAKSVAEEMKMKEFIREGVYCMQVGPNYETVTECRFIRQVGADAIGMSTIPEVLVARHAGMRVFGLSLITNMVILDYDCEQTANHEEVLETGKRRSSDLQQLVAQMVARL